jgi:hypothetical protein
MAVKIKDYIFHPYETRFGRSRLIISSRLGLISVLGPEERTRSSSPMCERLLFAEQR